MTAPKPMNEWQRDNLPDSLPLPFRRNIELGENGCWLWKITKNRDGYGLTSYKNKTSQAHRVAYTCIIGEVAPGLVIDHLCRVRHCVNPAHMEPVTNAVNLLRSELTPMGMKTCREGHELVPWYSQRRCILCMRKHNRAYDKRRSAELRAGKEYAGPDNPVGVHVAVVAL